MPLPFLQNKKTIASVIMAKRKPDGSTEETGSEGHEDDGMETCMMDLQKCLTSGDHKGMAKAFRDAFEILDAEPHTEFDHDSDNSYDSQNEKAGQE